MIRRTYRSLRRRAGYSLRRIPGYDKRNWLRIRQIEAFENFLKDGGKSESPVLEISPGWNTYWKFRCTSYSSVDFPEFDICKDQLSQVFPTVIADQVLEHVQRPIEACRNIFAMVAPGGWALIATPFLFRVHARPHDYNRWTAAGLKQLLVEGGFAASSIDAFSWGNKACARAHIGGPVRDYGFFRPMQNDEEYPMMVWAFAHKPEQ